LLAKCVNLILLVSHANLFIAIAFKKGGKTIRKDYEEVGIETAEGEGEEEGYGDEF